MQILLQAISFILHLDDHLVWMIDKFGVWSYLILFMILFMETGLVLTPFLPGDSLVFAVGALAALGSFNIWLLYMLLVFAAIVGDSVNYSIGHYIGPKVFKIKSRFINKIYLKRTQEFFDKHGGKTIVLARFIPIIRTFAPFLAGVGEMSYIKFLSYNIIGGLAWISLFLFSGYYFGNISFVKENFSLVLIAIIIISLLPVVVEYIRHKRKK